MTTTQSTETDDAPPPATIALAIKDGHLYAYVGPGTATPPIRFRCVTREGSFRVDNQAHLITQQLNGVQFFTRPLDSHDGQVLADLVLDLEGDGSKEDVLATIDRYLDEHGGDDE